MSEYSEASTLPPPPADLPPPSEPTLPSEPPMPPLPPSGLPRPPRPRPQVPHVGLLHLALLVVAAIVTNIALRSGVAAAASTVAVLLISRLVDQPRRATFGFVIAALVFAVWLPMRASTWLTSLNTAAVVFFLAAAAATARPLAWRFTTDVVSTLLSRLWLGWSFPRVLIDSVAPLRTVQSGRITPILRGLALAVVPVVVLTALLASADAVFAQSITTDMDPSSLFGHLALTAACTAAIAAFLAMTGTPVDETFDEHRPLGATEALILLGSIGVLYAGFAVVQVLSALGRADAILQEQGVTYAEYARNGFFQLLWVAALTLLLLGIVRLLVASGSPLLDVLVRAAGAAVALLTTLIVTVAVLRLGLYTQAFGQTTLRWYCTAFAWMLGTAFVAIAIGHWPKAQGQLPRVLLSLVTITLFAVNVLNPEARVADHNLTRTDAVESLDALYLSRLSADAWPTILDHRALMDSQLPAGIQLADRCAEADASRGYGPLGFNLAEQRLSCS